MILNHLKKPIGCMRHQSTSGSREVNTAGTSHKSSSDNSYGMRDFIRERRSIDLPEPDSVHAAAELETKRRSGKRLQFTRTEWRRLKHKLRKSLTGIQRQLKKEEENAAMVFKEALEQVKENLSTEEREIAAVDLENMMEGTKEHLEMARQVLLAKEFEEDR